MTSEEASRAKEDRSVPPATGIQVARFASTGVLNTILDFLLFNLLVYGAGVSPVYANIASVSSGIVNSFIWNKYWTFRDGRREGMLSQVSAFVGISLIGMGINTAVLQALLVSAGDVSPLAVNGMKGVALVASATWNFLAYKYIVFRT